MRSKWILIFLAAAIITGCEFKCWVGDNGKTETKEVSSSESNGPLKGAIIKNDIVLDAKNVKVKEAYLVNESGTFISKNEIPLGEDISCVVILDTGWAKLGDKSFVGISEKLMTEEGVVILDEADLLKDNEATGVSATDAKVLSVSGKITQKKSGIDDYKMQFRMWDKKGDGEVTGSFKFKVN